MARSLPPLSAAPPSAGEMWFEPKGTNEIVGIPLGVLDGNDVPSPKIRVWTDSATGWAPVDGNLPQYHKGDA